MWFIKRKIRVNQNSMLEALRARCNRIGVMVSIWLTYKTAHLPKKKLITYLAIVGAVLLSLNLLMIINGIKDFGKAGKPMSDDLPPKIHIDTSHRVHIHQIPLSDSSMFLGYLDSLGSNNRAFDSLLQLRPGLRDSIEQIKRYYGIKGR